MAETFPTDSSLSSNLDIDRVDSSRCSMESLITSDSSDDLLVEASSEDSGELFVEGETGELDKVIFASSGTDQGVGSIGDHIQCDRERTNTVEAYTKAESSKLASTSEREIDQEKTSLSREKRDGSEKAGTKKKRRTRERKISICSDHSTFIAGVRVCYVV